MEAIKDTVKNVIQKWETQKQIYPNHNPEVLLSKVLTKKELEHVKFNYFSKGILSINVDSSTWLYHLSLKKEALFAKLHKRFTAIKDIRFYLGEIK